MAVMNVHVMCSSLKEVHYDMVMFMMMIIIIIIITIIIIIKVSYFFSDFFFYILQVDSDSSGLVHMEAANNNHSCKRFYGVLIIVYGVLA